MLLKMKCRFTAIIIFVVGLVFLSILVHEGTHGIQFPKLEKEMCISNTEPIAFVRIYGTNDTVHWYPVSETKGLDLDEVEAMLFQFVFLFIGLVYAYKNIDMFGK